MQLAHPKVTQPKRGLYGLKSAFVERKPTGDPVGQPLAGITAQSHNGSGNKENQSA